MSYDERKRRVIAAAAEFSGSFGLRSFPGKTGFYVSIADSYVDGSDKVQLYVFTESGKAFAKGTPDELRPLVVGRIPKEGQ